MDKKIFAISGSTRQHSSNYNLLKAIGKLIPKDVELTIYTDIGKLPHFNPDLNSEEITTVKDFRSQISTAAAVLICTPEYAHGVPGTLKNAIDWTVATGEFSGKPTALITASTDGTFSHHSLLETLKVIEAKNIENQNLLIQYINTKVNANGIIDEQTCTDVQNLVDRLINLATNC